MVIYVVEGDQVEVPGLGLCRVVLLHPSGACVVRRVCDRTSWLLSADLADEAGLVSMSPSPAEEEDYWRGGGR